MIRTALLPVHSVESLTTGKKLSAVRVGEHQCRLPKLQIGTLINRRSYSSLINYLSYDYFVQDRYPDMASIAVIGGGISGLSAAHALMKHGGEKIGKVVLYESSQRVGGWLQSTQFEDGSLFEHGPRSIRPAGHSANATLQLVEEVGLADQVISIPRTHPAAIKRMIYAKGQLNLLPNKAEDLFSAKPPLTTSLIKILAKEFWVKKSKEDDESVYDFFRRRFGDEIATYFSDSMCIGIYAGDSSKLSVRSCFKDVWNMEQKDGSVMWGALKPKSAEKKMMDLVDNALAEKAKEEKWSVWSLRNGLQALPDRIGELLSENSLTKIRLETPVTGLTFNKRAKALEVRTKDGVEVYDRVIAATYAGHLANVLSDDLGKLKFELRRIPAVTVAVVNMEFPEDLFDYAAFGYLIPSIENSPLLGVIFDSCLFREHNNKQEETTRLTCMMGGAYFEKHFGNPENANEEEMIQTALKTVAEHLGFDEEPLRVSLTLHKDCIPQYHVGHYKVVRSIREEIRDRKLRLSVIGSSYDGVSVNDCVHGGRLAARELVESL